MSKYKVTPEKIRNTKEEMIKKAQNINDAFELMMGNLEKLGDYFVNAKTADIVEILGIRKLDFLSTQVNLVRTIGSLDDIASGYAKAEKENTDELYSLN